MRIQIKKSYVFATVFLLIITFVFSVYQYFEALKANSASAVTVGTPNPGHTWSSMQCSADSLCVDTVNNRLGIGTNTPGVKLEVGANTAIKIGNAYLSSGGDFVHLANNEWYNGSAWTATAPGAMYQQTGQANNWYTHDASGGHTVRMQLDPTGNLTLNTGGLSIAGSMTGGTVPAARIGAGTLSGSYAFNSDVSVGGYKLTNVAAPVSSTDAATKAYVDASSGGVCYTVFGSSSCYSGYTAVVTGYSTAYYVNVSGAGMTVLCNPVAHDAGTGACANVYESSKDNRFSALNDEACAICCK